MRAVELFAGIGGFRLGLERTGHSVVWANEWDKYAADTYDKNFGGQIDRHDITAVSAGDIPKHQLICGGFPCQAFSVAGKRRGFEETRGTLFFEIMRIARHHRTPYLFLENVKGLLSHDEGRTFGVILRTLDELGYDCQWQVLNSKDFGVPQNRERVFIIGHLRGQPRPEVFPLGADGGKADEVRLEDDHTRRDSSDNQSQDGRPAERREISQALDSNYWKGIDNHGQRTAVLPVLTPDREKRQNGRQFKEDGEGSKQNWDSYEVEGRIRRLTPLECERLQGFPDGWTDSMSDTQRYKQMGNAVTVNVIEAIASKLYF